MDFLVVAVVSDALLMILIFPGFFDQMYLNYELSGCKKLTIEYWQPCQKPTWKSMKVITGQDEVQQAIDIFQIKYRLRTPMEICQCVSSFRMVFSLNGHEKIINMSHPFQKPHITINHNEYPLTDEGAKRLKVFFESNSLPDPELLMNSNP